MSFRGLEPASTLYFRIPLTELAEATTLALVAMVKAPRQFHCVRKQQAYG